MAENSTEVSLLVVMLVFTRQNWTNFIIENLCSKKMMVHVIYFLKAV